MFLFSILCSLWELGNDSSTILRKILPKFASGSYLSWKLCPASVNALWYSIFAILKISSLDDSELSLFLIPLGIASSVVFGLLLSLSTYNIVFPGFLYKGCKLVISCCEIHGYI